MSPSMSALWRAVGHGRLGAWDEVLFLGLAALVFAIIMLSSWRAGRQERNEDKGEPRGHDENIEPLD
jgi:hypothetical protein